MRAKLKKLLTDFRLSTPEGQHLTIDDRYDQITDYLIANGVIIPSEETITLSRAEIDALTEHDKKRTIVLLERIFFAVEELLQANYKLEDRQAGWCTTSQERGYHLYGRGLCERLLIDLYAIKRKYSDREV